MFKTAKRHVPSPAALKVLTQLAYITSGTVVGVAALCTEERRRRIKIVQRLADNARVIRQHPRYAANVTEARPQDGEGFEGWFGGGRREERMRRRRKTGKAWGVEEEAVRAPILPSVVDEGYEETVGLTLSGEVLQPTRTARPRSHRPFGVSAIPTKTTSPRNDGSKGMEVSKEGYVQTFRHVEIPPKPPDRVGPPWKARDQSLNAIRNDHFPYSRTASDVSPQRNPTMPKVSLQRPRNAVPTRRDQVLSGLDLESRLQESRKAGNVRFKNMIKLTDGSWSYDPAHDSHQAQRARNPFSTLGDIAYITRSAWRSQERTPMYRPLRNEEVVHLTADHITHDVELFFAKDLSITSRKYSLARQSYIASQLLLLAAGKGTLDDVRSLCLWMLERGTFSEWHSNLIVKSYSTLASAEDQIELLDFCAHVLSSTAYGRLGPRVQLDHKFFLIANAALSSTGPPNLFDIAEVVLGCKGTTTFPSNADDIVHGIESACRFLVDAGRPSLAAVVFMTFQRRHIHQRYFLTFPAPEAFAPAADMIIDGGIESGQLSAARRLLRWRYAQPHSFTERSAQQLNDFITRCDSYGMSSTLEGTFLSASRWNGDHTTQYIQKAVLPLDKLVGILDEPSKVILAQVSSRSPEHRRMFERLFSELPRSQQQQLVKSASLAAVLAQWQSTKSLREVEATISEIPSSVRGQPNFMSQIEDTMLDIYVDTGKLDAALAAISRLHETSGLTPRTITLATYLFAKRGLWAEVGRLTQIADQHKPFQLDFALTNVWDKVIGLYSRAHAVDQTRRFIEVLRHAVGYTPTTATSKAVLSACVRSRSLDLISSWLDYLKSLGHPFEFDGRVAADLLLTYWAENRPKHRRLMWLCHFITRHVPAFEYVHFHDVLKAAIGYDMRNPYEQDLSSGNPRVHTTSRLNRLDSQPGHLAIPGWSKFNGKRDLTLTRQSGLFSGVTVRYSSERYDSATTTEDTKDVRSTVTPSDARSNLDKDAPPSIARSGTFETELDIIPPHEPDAESPVLDYPMGTEEEYHALIAEYNIAPDETEVAQRAEGELRSADKDQAELQTNIAYSHVRPVGDALDTIREEILHASGRSGIHSRGHLMALRLSSRDYEKVMNMYRATLTKSGLPGSVRMLEIAVEACIRLHDGKTTEAEALLNRAAKAGMNVTCAMGPLIIQQMRNMDRVQKRNANKLRITVIDYYRMNDDNGWPVSHYIATTAAHILIENNCPEHGVNLLSAIYKSEWAARRPLDMPTMTVFLMGYNKMKYLPGVQWVVEHVLNSSMKITRRFMRELKRSFKLPEDKNPKSRRAKVCFTNDSDRALLRSWAEKCYTKRLQQIHDDYVFGVQLEWTIKKCARQQGLAVLADQDNAYMAFVHGALEPGRFDEEFAPMDVSDEVFGNRRVKSAVAEAGYGEDDEEGMWRDEDDPPYDSFDPEPAVASTTSANSVHEEEAKDTPDDREERKEEDQSLPTDRLRSGRSALENLRAPKAPREKKDGIRDENSPHSSFSPSQPIKKKLQTQTPSEGHGEEAPASYKPFA